MNETFKIISLEASNIKVLKAVHITPDKNVVTLSGANGSGKSSVLDSIAYALGGKDALCDQPIRRGTSKAEIICTLNGLVITRKFSATGTTLSVTTEDGTPQKSPQAILDALVGNLAFDPLSFARMAPAQQLKTLQQLVGLDFTAQDVEKARLYNERTVINREADRLKAAASIDAHYPDAPKEEVSLADLQSELAKAEETNRSNGALRVESDNAVTAAKNTSDRVQYLNGELARIQKQLDEAKAADATAQLACKAKTDALANLKDVDTAELRTRIGNAESINRMVRANAAKAEKQAAAIAKQKESTAFTAKIEAIEKARESALSKAKFPLPGLTFDDGSVVFNGIPFSQASDGEKLRISVAVGMAINPKLRVIFIRDGSLLDENGLKTVAELAQANDYQVWLEDARSTDPTALVIEAGEVVSKSTKEAQTELVPA